MNFYFHHTGDKMLVENKLLKKVKELGLNSYEAKIWTALLSRGVSTAGEISDIANVPRSRSYDVLESLEKKGFIIMKVGKPIQYISVSPKEVLERVKNNVVQEAEEKVDVLDEFQDSELLTELIELHKNGIESVDPTDIAGYIKTTNNITDQMKTMIKNAEKTIFISTNLKGTQLIKEDLSRYLKKAISNNIKVFVNSPSNINIEGVEFFNTKGDNRFMVADNQTLLYITGEKIHSDYETAIWVDSPQLSNTMTEVFKHNLNNNTKIKAESVLKTTITKKA